MSRLIKTLLPVCQMVLHMAPQKQPEILKMLAFIDGPENIRHSAIIITTSNMQEPNIQE